MTEKKRPWREPIIKSINRCQPIFGECRVGTSPAPGGAIQCNTGTGATTTGDCTVGNGAKANCVSGNGVK